MIGYQVANQLRAANCGKGANQVRQHQHQISPSPSPSPKLTNQLGESATSSYSSHELNESVMINRAIIKRECEAATTSNDLSIHRYAGNSNLLIDRKSQQDSNQMRAHLLNHHQQHHNNSSTSPGYHSNASSPCSTADSPVSSSSSSGVSSASHSSSNHSNTIISTNNTNSNASIKTSQPASMHQSVLVSPFHLMDYFPELNNDGLNLSWAHEANNRAKLNEALLSTKMIISGHIALAEMSRYPVPIMARAPVGVSDLTLENWVQEVTQVRPQRAIKLTFTSTRTVEPAFRVLARHAESLKGPLILSADILSRNSTSSSSGNGKASKQQQQQSPDNQSHQPVDAWTFLMMCRTKFPKCTISIGWCPSEVAAGFDEPQHQLTQQIQMTLATNTSHPSLAQANNNCNIHSSVDQFFDLDMMIDSRPALSQLVDASHLGHLQHLNHHQNRLHHSLHPYPLIHHHHQRQHSNYGNQHIQNHRHSHHHHLAAHPLISSGGSLSSSSGNSSGSPSPTSPISQLLTPPYQIVAANLSLAGNKSNQLEQAATEQLLLNACARNQQSNGGHDAAAAAAAAAAMTAALVAASKLHQQQPQQQLPLNLNINEADQKQIASLGSNGSSSNQMHKCHQRFQNSQQNLAHAANDSLASRLFGSSGNNCGHIQKKLALGGNPAAVSGRPCSPQSTFDSSRRRTSPKLNRHLQQDGNLLLKTTMEQPSNQLQQQPKVAQNSGGGYTREMIDKMASIVKEYNLTQPVTFPVEARCLLGNQSLGELQRLLYQIGSNSTLTVVAHHDDLISVDDLLLIRRSFAANQLLFDLPERLVSALRRELD